MRSAAFFALLSVICLLGISTTAVAQTRTNSSGTGGIHQIRGRVYLPSGKSLDTSIEVELQGSFTSLKVFTDRSGSYAFENLAPGNYTVVVNVSDQFEPVREYVTLDTEPQGNMRILPVPKIVNVPIYLQPKRSGNSDGVNNEVVNARWATVPRDAIEHYRQGLDLIRQNKAEQAAAEFHKSVAIAPSFAPAHTALGKLALIAGRLDDAVDEFKTAISYDSDDFESRLNYGIALLNKRDIPDAQKELSHAADLNKTAVTPRYYLGIVYIQKKDLNAAQKQMEAARELAGPNGYPLVHRYLGGIYWQKGATAAAPDEQKNMFRLAIQELEKYISLEPKAGDASQIRDTIAQLRSKLG